MNINYVYYHIHPETDEIVYVGHGTNERAWRCTSSGHPRNYGHRSPDHVGWTDALQLKGFTPDDWVQIIYKGLKKSDACKIEQEQIRNLNPRFNKPLGKKLLKLTQSQLKEADNLRDQGLSYFDIADTLGVSTMCMWRALNGKNKNAPDV